VSTNRGGERGAFLAWVGALVLIGAVTALSGYSLLELIAATEARSHALAVLARLDDLNAELMEAQAHRRGFILRPQGEDRADFEAAVGRAPGKLADLRRLTADNASQQERLDRLEPVFESFLALLRRSVALARPKKPLDPQQLPLTLESEKLQRQVRQALGEMAEEERGVLDRRDRHARNMGRAAVTFIGLGGALALALVSLARYALRRELRARLRAEEALRQANQHLESRVADATGALRESEERYRHLVEVCPDAIVIAREEEVRYLNPAGLELFRASPLATVGRPLLGLFHPGYHPLLRSRLERMRATGQRAPLLEGLAVRIDGELLEVEAAAAPFTDRGEACYLFILRDVSERNRVLAELQKTATRLQAILDTTVDGIITINTEGMVETFNRAAEGMFGYAAQEVVGRNVSLLMPPPHRQEHDHYLARYLETGVRRVIGIGRAAEGLRKDGTLFPVELAISESASSEHRWFTGVLRDLTDRKRDLDRIREQAALLDKVSDAILVVGEDGQVLSWNQGASRMYGWPAEEAQGKDVQALLGPGSAGGWDEARREAAERGEWVGELRQRARDGRELIVAAHWALLRGEQGRPRATVMIHIDVTEKKKLEQRELRGQRLESIGTLAGGIAHDLNNVLTPILMAVKLLRRDRPEADRQALLGTAQASVERGVELVKQLLAFAGGGESERSPQAPDRVVTEVRALLERTLPRSITLRTEVPEELWAVVGDATQLTQVLLNLCINARDAMPDGGTLAVSVANVHLTASYARNHPEARPGPYVRFSVTDTGTGIPPEVMDRIFDPFFTTKPHGKGTGLGLSTVLGIVKGHGGVVNVYSEAGKGTQVTVFLPAEQGEAGEAADPRPAGDVPLGRGELVLVVDDEALILLTVRATLESFGYRAVTAGSGAEALGLFGRHRDQVAAVILDRMMPGMDGLATLKALRGVRSDVKAIVTSGLATPERSAEVLAAGARAVLAKPYAEEKLLRLLAEVIRGEGAG
jgi:PAS domain S-box-containing protein